MNDQSCEHRVLRDLSGSAPGARTRLIRCDQHSCPQAGIDVWAWSRRPLPSQCCPCEIADRFVVATEHANLLGIEKTDVVHGPPQTTVHGASCVAERLSGLPGYTLIAVSAGRRRTVFRTRTQQVVVSVEHDGPQVCGICLYPWLAAGHCLDELVALLS